MGKVPNLNSLKERQKFLMSLQGLNCFQKPGPIKKSSLDSAFSSR